MSKLQISPESLEIANLYLETQSISETADKLCISKERVSDMLNKAEVKRYIDNLYLDYGYRNRFRLGALLDRIIDNKIEEAKESEMWTGKDLIELIKLSHTMRMDEIKANATTSSVTNQTNIQVNESPFGNGKYGKLMDTLLGDVKEVTEVTEVTE